MNHGMRPTAHCIRNWLRTQSFTSVNEAEMALRLPWNMVSGSARELTGEFNSFEVLPT